MPRRRRNRPPTQAAAATPVDPANDPAEIAYDEGFQLWKAGKYDEAITSLRAFSSAYPKHRRTSWANNLAGRALLDKGEPRAAAEALLANYRSNPKGERAPDSLYYLGQALMQLNQPAQACKAYSELEVVYGASLRAELKRLLPPPRRTRAVAKTGFLLYVAPRSGDPDWAHASQSAVRTPDSSRRFAANLDALVAPGRRSASRYRAGRTAWRCCCWPRRLGRD